jgi:hypothetical protein
MRVSPCASWFRRFWWNDGAYVSLMLALFALRFLPAFAHGARYAPFRDNVWLYGSFFSRASEIALTGDFPYWLDTVLGGFPLYQTPHFSATYPFYFFGLLNYGKELGALDTLSYLTCFHTLILYLNLYIMLRVAGVRGLASLCGATVGLVSGNTEVDAHWITIAAAYSWFPLLVAGMIQMFRTPLSFGSIALFSIAGSLMCTASPSQPVIQAAFVCAIFFTAAIIWRWRRDGIGAAVRLLLGLAVSGIIAFCLAGVAFLPMTLATGGMIRHGPRPPLIGHQSIPWASFNLHQLKPGFIPHLLFDSSDLGEVIGGLYVGPLALLGVLACCISYKRANAFSRFLILTFGLIGLYFLLAAFGTHFGLAYLHFYIPLLNRIREAGRYLAVFTALTALMAGLGYQVIEDVLTGKLQLSGRWRRYFWISLTLGLVVFLLALLFDRHEKEGGGLVLAAFLLSWFILPALSLRQRAVGGGLVLLTCFSSMLAPPDTKPFYTSEYLLTNNLNSLRVLRRIAQFPDMAKYRVVVQDTALTPTTWGDNASYYGIRTFYVNFTPQPYDQFREMFDERTVNLRKIRGAKYFVCGQTALPFDPKAELCFTESGYRVYQVADALGPFTLAHKVALFADNKRFRGKLAMGFDYQHVAALQEAKGRTIPPSLLAGKSENVVEIPDDTIDSIRHTPNVFDVFVDSSKPGLFILNERWSKDWHARINSRPAEVLQANFTQPAVVLLAGRNYVEFEYKPMLFWYLLILQRVSFVLLLLVGIRKLFVGWSRIEPVASDLPQ